MKHRVLRQTSLRAFAPVALTLVLAACGGRGAPVPDLSGALSGVIVDAALAGARAPAPSGSAGGAVAPLLLDSIAFGRLGDAVGAGRFSSDEVRRQLHRDVTLVDAASVLICPPREPCRVRDDGTFITLWDAASSGGVVNVVVSRAWNEDRMYTMTRHETLRLELRGAGDAWRLTGLYRVSP